MASPGLAAFDAYVNTRDATDKDKAALKVRGERLYLDVYRELPLLLAVLGDADVLAKPTDIKLAERQTAFKLWYAEMEADGVAVHHYINDQLEKGSITGVAL